jgi:uncharacterized protein YdiU (UPF0061 family)
MDNGAQTDFEAGEIGWKFDNSYARLPEVFFAKARPVKFRLPQIVIANHELAATLGLDLTVLSEQQQALLFAGQVIPDGAEPIAQAYAGHQYGGFTMLGDGRAILLGEHCTPDGNRVDVQFKGSGDTPFSRRGDGRAALGPMLREYIISEAMAVLGIPTTRSLAVVTTGEPVYRESVLRGAVLTRIAASHIRVGTFQFLAARQDRVNLQKLADYTIARHYPEIQDRADKYYEFFKAVVDRQASLIARWQLVGFVHGVMNTDNMAISGETIDYGPCAFMDTYHPDTVFSSIDEYGRYAYSNQPAIAQWNLARFAETILHLLSENEETQMELAKKTLYDFAEIYDGYWLKGMRRKLGLEIEEEGDRELINTFLEHLQNAGADFTLSFRNLVKAGGMNIVSSSDGSFQNWYRRWLERLGRESKSLEQAALLMNQVNPLVIPRNHKVEEALEAAQKNDLSPFQALLSAVREPFHETEAAEVFSIAPPSNQCRYKTFCGT